MKSHGASELKSVSAKSRSLFWTVGVFSVFVNLLMLTGPLFMLQVYDRVLGSRSEETLLALFGLMTFLFLIMGALDHARGKILSRIGARFQSRLDRRVFLAMARQAASQQNGDASAPNNLRDLESVQKVLSSPVLTAIFDMPWMPIFLLTITLFHPWLGILAIAGGLFLTVVTILNQTFTTEPQARSGAASMVAERMSETVRREAEMVRALGMQDSIFVRWSKLRDESLFQSIRAADRGGIFTNISKTFRLFLQSAMLGLGAYLVLKDQMTAGGMIASSILMGRALAPVDMALGQWQLLQRARRGWKSLETLLSAIPEDSKRMSLPRPKGKLVVQAVSVIPPGKTQPTLRGVSFNVNPGEAVGIIGPSGSGKSTLARAIVGAWSVAGGRIQLGGAALDQYGPDVLGSHIGYLPQKVDLFDGTIAENIARMAETLDDGAVVRAAIKAAAHDMILDLPDGYDTQVTSSGGQLSGGQIQRIGLARALYRDPVLLVLDEPNSNLDNAGSEALNRATQQVKAGGGAVLIMAHRPSAITECEKILVLDGGTRAAFGDKATVLAAMTKNHQIVARAAGVHQGGVA